MHSFLHRFDSHITKVVTRWPKSLTLLFIVITTLADPTVIVGIGAVVAGTGIASHSSELIVAGAVIWITLAIGTLLKIIFGRARPLTEYAAKMRIMTYSFPSGHTAGATVAYGFLGYAGLYVLAEPWGYVLNIFTTSLIITAGISRIYVGAHFPSDVVAGWVVGATALAIIIDVVRPFA